MKQQLAEIFDNSLITTLYREHSIDIFKYLYACTCIREDAEDLLVEVFLAALNNQKLACLNQREQKAWLVCVARNKMIDWRRRTKRRPSTSLAFIRDILYDDEEHWPEQVVLRQEEYALLHARLEKLSRLQREVVQLHFIAELSCAEIATLLAKRENAVRIALSRGLNALRTIYQKS